MANERLVSLRSAARALQVDRATLARLVDERNVASAGQRGGHAVFRLAELRRVYEAEFYGDAPPPIPTCDECWGPLVHHRNGKPCAPGSYEEGQRLDAWWRALSLDEQRRLMRGK